MPSNFDIRAVTLASALAWARGEIHDSKLDTSRHEVIFWNELLDRASYRAALAEIVRLHRLECCPAMIVHACNPVVWRKLERERCVVTCQEELIWRDSARTARRYLALPGALAAWIAKLHIQTPSPKIKTRQNES